MKKLLVSLLLAAGLAIVAFGLSEEGVFLSKDLGKVKIVYTQREAIPTPNHGTVYIANNFGVMDNNGNYIVEPVYQRIYEPKEGRTLIYTQDNKYGYLDENWKVVVKPAYSGAESFSEGLARVMDEKGMCGFIDKSGKVVIPFKYDRASSFKNGLATVEMIDEGYNYHTFARSGKIDKKGNIVEAIKYRWEKYYDVQMSLNNVRLNGHTYENDKLAYPYINYLGYTYIPLTYYGAQEMGYDSKWTPETGLVLTSSKDSETNPANDGKPLDALYGKNTMKKGKMFKAQLYKGKITVNGVTYTAEDVYYPILTCNDVVYFPVLWKQGMEGLGLKYSYDMGTKSLVIDVGLDK